MAQGRLVYMMVESRPAVKVKLGSLGNEMQRTGASKHGLLILAMVEPEELVYRHVEELRDSLVSCPRLRLPWLMWLHLSGLPIVCHMPQTMYWKVQPSKLSCHNSYVSSELVRHEISVAYVVVLEHASIRIVCVGD